MDNKNMQKEQGKVDYDAFITSLENKINLLGIVPAKDYNRLQFLLSSSVSKSTELRRGLENCMYDLIEKTYRYVCKRDESIFIFINKNYPNLDRVMKLDPDLVKCKHQLNCNHLIFTEYKCVFKR